jgi:hypothetical protein
MRPSRSTPRLKATSSSAAPNRRATSSSTSEAGREAMNAPTDAMVSIDTIVQQIRLHAPGYFWNRASLVAENKPLRQQLLGARKH